MSAIHPVGDTHFGLKSLFAGVYVKIKEGWRILTETILKKLKRGTLLVRKEML